MDLIDLMPKGAIPSQHTMTAELQAARLFATGAISVFQSDATYTVQNDSENVVTVDGITIQPGETVTICEG